MERLSPGAPAAAAAGSRSFGLPGGGESNYALNIPPDLQQEEQGVLDEKIDHALAQAAAGNLYGPEEARRKLAAMREAHLSDLGR